MKSIEHTHEYRTRERWRKNKQGHQALVSRSLSEFKKGSATLLHRLLKGHVFSEMTMLIGPTRSIPLVVTPNGRIPTILRKATSGSMGNWCIMALVVRSAALLSNRPCSIEESQDLIMGICSGKTPECRSAC